MYYCLNVLFIVVAHCIGLSFLRQRIRNLFKRCFFLRSLACARDDRTIECVILFHIYPFGKFTTIFVIIYRLPYFFIKKMRNGVVCLIILLLAFAFHYTHQQLSTLIVHLYFTLSLSFMSFRRAKGPKRPAHGKM